MKDSKNRNVFVDYPDELQHHGVPGMRWGEHRYQEPTTKRLTVKGETRFQEVAASKHKTARDTRRAKRAYRDYAAVETTKATIDAKKAEMAKKVFDNKQFSKYAKSAKLHSQMASAAKKKIAAIDAGTYKAGRDFIIQRDNYFLSYGSAIKNFKMGPSHVALFSKFKAATGVGGVTVDRVIERPKNK